MGLEPTGVFWDRHVFEFYKKGQGKWTRGLTMAGGAGIVVLGAWWLYEEPLATIGYRLPGNYGLLLQAFGAALFVVLGLYLSFWVSYVRHGSGDFFIATEGEMKKVSWSSRKEIVGSTQVVIFTLIFMGVLLFVVDLGFMLLFYLLGVLKVSPFSAEGL